MDSVIIEKADNGYVMRFWRGDERPEETIRVASTIEQVLDEVELELELTSDA